MVYFNIINIGALPINIYIYRSSTLNVNVLSNHLIEDLEKLIYCKFRDIHMVLAKTFTFTFLHFIFKLIKQKKCQTFSWGERNNLYIKYK